MKTLYVSGDRNKDLTLFYSYGASRFLLKDLAFQVSITDVALLPRAIIIKHDVLKS